MCNLGAVQRSFWLSKFAKTMRNGIYIFVFWRGIAMVTRRPRQVPYRVTNPLFTYYFNIKMMRKSTYKRTILCLKAWLNFGHGLILDLHRADWLAGNLQEAVQIGQVQYFR